MGTNVLSRLDGTVAGLLFNNRIVDENSNDNIVVRGISSFQSSVSAPLVILDNLPYEGDLKNINPNDVENITILKDAAAASIWGTRAGNGVIVITTKKGAYNKKTSVSINSNLTISDKPDLFKIPIMTSSEYIDAEKFIFSKGFYDGRLASNDPYTLVSPVVLLLNQQRNLPESAISDRLSIENQIDNLRSHDVRTDYLKYFYRNNIDQQYAANINGGTDNIAYIFSGGFDKNLNSAITSTDRRATIKSNVTLKPLKNLEVNTGVLYIENRVNNTGDPLALTYSQDRYYPYTKFTNENGIPVAVQRTYRQSFVDQLSSNPNLLDWRYVPIDDLDKSSIKTPSNDLLLNIGTKYQIKQYLSAEILYQYQNGSSNTLSTFNQDSYYSRNLINLYTNPETYDRGIPLGAIAERTSAKFNSQTIRMQVNFNKEWNKLNRIDFLTGAEARKNSTTSFSSGRMFGYNTTTNNYQPVDIMEDLPFFTGGSGRIGDSRGVDANYNRFTSVFANGAYSYMDKYILSASVRKDASNVFGDNTNKQGSPLWSGGLSWILSNENFYNLSFLSFLKFRFTYGYSGNVVTGVPAYSVASYVGNDDYTNLPYAVTTNPPNPSLRWEKVGMTNYGLDFSSKNNIISGSIEYFKKNSTDLIAEAPIDPSKGFETVTLNSANIKGQGVDITLNSKNFESKSFRWNTTLIFNYNKSVTSKYLLKQPAGSFLAQSNNVNPIEGKDVYGIFAYKFAGLDEQLENLWDI